MRLLPALVTLPLALGTPHAAADFASVEVDSVETEVMGTPVAIHRLYARPTAPGTKVIGVLAFQVVAGSALFHHRDFETAGTLSTELGTWNPYLGGTAASSGDSHVILGGGAGAGANGGIAFSNWEADEYTAAQPAFRGDLWPGVDWFTTNPAQMLPDASGRVVLAQFVTRRTDAFLARFRLSGTRLSAPWVEWHTADIASGASADDCPADPSKVLPGQCGCGEQETDADGDGSADCIDRELGLAQMIDFGTLSKQVLWGSGADIRVAGDRAMVGTTLAYGNSGGTTILRRAVDAGGATRWIPEATLGGPGGPNSVARLPVAFSGAHAAYTAVLGELGRKVRIFSRSAEDAWSLSQTISAPFGSAVPSSRFGLALALRGDWLAVGSTSDDTATSGEVALYRLGDDGWLHVQSLAPMQRPAPRFGLQVALGDGVLVVSHGGGLTVFALGPSGAWEAVEDLAPPDGYQYVDFGESLALDGDALVAGCSHFWAGSPNPIGGATVYRRGPDGRFAAEAILRSEENADPLRFDGYSGGLGQAVSISGDVVAIGSEYTRRAFVFRRGVDGAWRSAHVIARGVESIRQFGHGLALAGDELLVGDPDFLAPESPRPRVQVFDLDPARLGDLDRDGAVGPTDLSVLLEVWNSDDPYADLDGNGLVEARDLAFLLLQWSDAAF